MNDSLDPNARQVSPSGVQQQKQIPRSIAVMVLGIVSIAACAIYGLPGLVCGIIALIMHRKVKAIHDSDPVSYARSYRFARAGYICGIIGTCLSAAFFVFLIIYVVYMAIIYSAVSNEIYYNNDMEDLNDILRDLEDY